MSYVGNTPTTQAFTPAIDYFSGNGSTVAFTLSRPVASVAQVQVTVNNVPQNPGSAFTVSGQTLTFTGTPSSGTNNIYVQYTSPITQVIQPGQGTVGATQLLDASVTAAKLASGVLTPASVSDQANTSTGYFDLPSGTTAQRPVSPAEGMIRYNTSNVEYEVYQAGSWKALTTQTVGLYSVDALIVGGGGSGGGATSGLYDGGGGGAGGYQAVTTNVTALTAYTVTIGAGGTGNTTSTNNGIASSISSIGSSSVGGGGGAAGASATGSSGGSGGGGSHPNGAAGSGTSGQGNAGGAAGNGAPQYGAGGGGGAGAVGGAGSASNGGNGGAGLNWQSLGTFYAGGGGGGVYGGSSAGTGGSGGGGAGGASSNGTNGTANTGGGGGGAAGNSSSYAGGSGGSGVVIIRYLGAQRGTGGTYSSAGGYSYHTFTTSGTYTA